MYFMLKYPPARPTFPGDMTEAEREIMNTHVAYWKNLMDHGHVLVFGPVMDDKGPYGLGIVKAESEDQVRGFIRNDPAVQGKLMNTEFYPMNAVVPEK
ncbi:YciI family protein [Paenibacillus humicola]|uniref:YciI family protein n=1 Tax=Paenibacillus humicola TaxID=3110540 RepID=UPI00237BDA33|nr:YciI family protein [Paenibacillus humicola]